MYGLLDWVDDFENRPYDELIECDSLREARKLKKTEYPNGRVIEYKYIYDD